VSDKVRIEERRVDDNIKGDEPRLRGRTFSPRDIECSNLRKGATRMANQEITTLLIDRIETRTKAAGQTIRATANSLRTIAGHLREDDTTVAAADLADGGADMIDRVGAYLEQNDFDTLMSDAEDFSRERPWAVTSVGMLTGLLASRLLKSAATRRHVTAQPNRPPTASDQSAENVSASASPARTPPQRNRAKAVTDGI
jgi:hypothetical protein